MRTIPRALGPDEQPASMVVPQVAPSSDVDPAMLSDASAQRGVSSIAGLPVQVQNPGPTMDPADAGAVLGYARQAQLQPQPQAPPQQPLQPLQPQAQSLPSTQVMAEPQQSPPSQSANWRVICQGVVEDAKMDETGCGVVVRSADGRRFAAYIPNVPVMELGIGVELGVKSERNGRTEEVRTVADVIRLQ